MGKSQQKVEFGDFQTPTELAQQVCTLIASQQIAPASIVEPTCGVGHFLISALDTFSDAQSVIGLEINSNYLDTLQKIIASRSDSDQVELISDNFFQADWNQILSDLPEPILILGNPPWVTNSELGSLQSNNLPAKSNVAGNSGMDALTGKSNFDISEGVIRTFSRNLHGKDAALALLCKTSVARKGLVDIWENGFSLKQASLYHIDAKKWFGVAVDACLLICQFSKKVSDCNQAEIYNSLFDKKPSKQMGYCEGRLISNITSYNKWNHLQGNTDYYRWRSGVKHDCSKVMELRRQNGSFLNGLEEEVSLEEEYLFPMLKSSEIYNEKHHDPTRWMLVPQKKTGDETKIIKSQAPQTWDYLQQHAKYLDRRKSSIYRKRPRFSVFGIGPYTFTPWKVAISGFYKQLKFVAVGSVAGKPIVLDDTAYSIDCTSEEEATFFAEMLNSEIANEFFSSFIFLDTKRPVTAEILNSLDIEALAIELGTLEKFQLYVSLHTNNNGAKQLQLFD